MKITDIYSSFISHLQTVTYPVGTKLEKHRVLPQHDGGRYTDGNVVLCSFENHRLAHYYRYLAYRQPGDLIAWKLMSGQTEEGRREMARYAGTIGGGANAKLRKEKAEFFFSPEWQALHGYKSAGTRNVNSGWLAQLNADITANRPEQRKAAGRKGGGKRIANQRANKTNLFDPKHMMQKKGNLSRWGVLINGVRIAYDDLSSDFIDYYLAYGDPKDFR